MPARRPTQACRKDTLNPHDFLKIDEEALRSHFLVQLNARYKGGATGETFNFLGKTDILIRVNGANVFIGECKFWRGSKAFLDTIGQLLSYLSWRDTKAAVLVFNRNKDFTAVVGQIKASIYAHHCFRCHVKDLDETSFRYLFTHPSDSCREVLLTVLAFDIPTDPANRTVINERRDSEVEE